MKNKKGWKVGKGARIVRSKIQARQVEIGEGSTLAGVHITAPSLSVGKDSRLEECKLFSTDGPIRIGDGVNIKERSVLNAFRGISIGDRTIIDRDVFVGGMQSEKSELAVGSDCVILYRSYLNTTRKITIGNGTGVGGYVRIFTHSAWQNALTGNPVRFADVNLGNDVWIAWDITIMPGVTVHDKATVGTGALVTKDIPPDCIAVGVPARVVKDRTREPQDLPDKNRLMIDILNDFEGYAASFLKLRVSLKTTRDSCIVRMPHNRVLEFRPFLEDFKEPDSKSVLISFRIPNAIKRGGTEWVELDTLSAKAPSATEFIEFIRRYGVRILQADKR
ncbi:MAG: acyltransferase [Nitrososphaera sp.]|jgi:acetyltransferase-like isoleucine patch superfamily enzyme